MRSYLLNENNFSNYLILFADNDNFLMFQGHFKLSNYKIR